VHMVDDQGRAYTCELPPAGQPPPPLLPPVGAAGSAAPVLPPPERPAAPAAGSSNARIPVPSATQLLNPPSVESILTPLHTGCVKKKTGWWTYEVCHGDEVRQYHEEDNRIDSSQSWSLGKIDLHSSDSSGSSSGDSGGGNGGSPGGPTQQQHPSAAWFRTHPRTESKPGYVAVQFAGGQICDEINAPRSGEIRYICGAAPTASTRSAIGSIEEPSKCAYRITIAVPALCALPELKSAAAAARARKQDAAAAGAAGGAGGEGGETVGGTSESSGAGMSAPAPAPAPELDAINSVAAWYKERCFYRVDGWWTYELCVNKHVRQFRQEGNTVEQEYILGLFQPEAQSQQQQQQQQPPADPSTDGHDDDDEHGREGGAEAREDGGAGAEGARDGVVGGKRYIARLHKRDPERSYASADYTGGDACELEPQWEVSRYRSTEVRFQCSENGLDSLLSVREVTTCAYQLIFASAKLCQLPEFSLARQPQQIVCYLDADQQPQQQPQQQQQQDDDGGEEDKEEEKEDEGGGSK
jgi:hypothetical protein